MRIEQTLVRQFCGQEPRHRLGDGHHHMQRLRVHDAAVVLQHDPPLVQNHDGVGVGGGQHIGPMERSASGHGLEGGVPQGGAQSLREGGARLVGPRDGARGHQFARMGKRPTKLRKSVITTIGKGDALVRRHRLALHPTQDARVGLLRISKNPAIQTTGNYRPKGRGRGGINWGHGLGSRWASAASWGRKYALLLAFCAGRTIA